MQRRRFKQVESLGARLAEEAKRLREKAKSPPYGSTAKDLPQGPARRNRAHMTEWLPSPGLRPPVGRRYLLKPSSKSLFVREMNKPTPAVLVLGAAPRQGGRCYVREVFGTGSTH